MSAKNQTNLRKEDFIYAGIDLHKETHTAVILDCWNSLGRSLLSIPRLSSRS